MDYNIKYTDILVDSAFSSIQLGTKFLINTLAHAKEKPFFREYCDSLKAIYSRHIPGCKWLLETVTKVRLNHCFSNYNDRIPIG